MNARTASTATALTTTLGSATAAWLLVVPKMEDMDTTPGTGLGPFTFLVALWLPMMAAMMLPGAVPAVLRATRASGRVRAAPMFVGSYLAIWSLVGTAAWVVYGPHRPFVAGAIVLAAGMYELTPLKREFRRRCRGGGGSGVRFGLCCVGSSIGLMLMLVALGVMSVPWMIVITVVVLGQKILAPTFVIDVPIALAIVGLGIAIALAPSSIPWLMPQM